MVITTQEYLKVRIPYIKSTILFLLVLVFFVLSFWALSIFLINKNFYYLIFFFVFLVLFLALRTISCLVNSFLENIGLIIFPVILLFGFLFYVLKFQYENLNLILYIVVIFIFFNLILWWKIKRIYESLIKLDFSKLFLTSWDFYIYILIFSFFLWLIVGYDVQSLSKDKIINFISSLNYFFEVLNLGITPNTKVSDILTKNLPQNIDEKTKEQMIEIAIAELNKNFNLNLKKDSTFKEAISDYIVNRIENLRQTPSTFMSVKIIIGLIIILVLRYILIILGYFGLIIAFLIFSLIKYLKLVEIKFEKIDKEVISI